MIGFLLHILLSFLQFSAPLLSFLTFPHPFDDALKDIFQLSSGLPAMNKVSDAVAEFVSLKTTKFTVLGILTFYLLKKWKERAEMNKIRSSFDARIEVAKRDREEAIEWARNESEVVYEEERERIASMNFIELRDALQTGEVTAESVIRVYFGLAIQAHEKTNCLTNIVKEALSEAREMDEKAKDSNYKKPRLFGIPISVKDSIALGGQRSTWGLAKLVDNYPTEDMYPIMKLRLEGAIPFAQTNVPAAGMTYMCSNTIYGTTTNPHSSSRTCGGSSGGEGALVASRGSIVGLAADIGGSIRIPAAYSGCCGFKPSATRFSLLQYKEPVPMRPFLMPTEGPIAQDPNAIVEIMRAIWSDHFMSDQDPTSYYTSDGYIDPLPGNRRVVSEAVELLREKGHDLVPFDMEDIVVQMARGIFCAVSADGGAMQKKILEEEPLNSLMSPLRDNGQMSMLKKRLLGWICKWRGDNTTADALLMQSTRSADIQSAIDLVYSTRKRLVKKMKDEGIDLLLSPSTISPALPHDLPNNIPFTAIMPTIFWNAMDYPAGVITTGSWTEEDEEALEFYPEKGLVEAEVKRGCRGSVGLPLSVQIVAPSFRDESVLRVMVDLFDSISK